MPDLMTADSPSVSEKIASPTYGIFLVDADGAPQIVLEPDSFIGYSYMNESRISQYPQEAGAFQQYNKVDTPFDVRITMTKGGKTSEVSLFIEKVEGLVKATNLNLYTVITPERTYNSVNISKVSHDHKPNHGANMVTVEIFLTEIRVSGTAQYANTNQMLSLITDGKSPTSQSPQSAGTVQPATATPETVTSVTNAIAQAEIAQNHQKMSH
jgi:hypothetical protein